MSKQVKSFDNKVYYIERTDKVNGPAQTSGLRFGKYSTYISEDGDNWTKTNFADIIKLECCIKTSESKQIQNLFFGE